MSKLTDRVVMTAILTINIVILPFSSISLSEFICFHARSQKFTLLFPFSQMFPISDSKNSYPCLNTFFRTPCIYVRREKQANYDVFFEF